MKEVFLNKLVLLALLVLFAQASMAQVSIGTAEKPVEGALLQLKNKVGITDGAANATGGLGLPRVDLTDPDMLYPMFPKDYDKSAEDEVHTGLVVMNVHDGDVCPGFNVWDGESWQLIPQPEDPSGYNPNTQILTDFEGNEYLTRRFGKAGRWMVENLRSTKLYPCFKLNYIPGGNLNGDFRLLVYTYPNMDANITPALLKKQGLLYSFAAANLRKPAMTNDKGDGEGWQGVPNDPENVEQRGVQGMCPDGWHLPSDKEWNEMEQYMTENAELHSTGTSSVWDVAYNYISGAEVANYRGNHGYLFGSRTSVTGGLEPSGKSFSGENGGFDAMLTGNVGFGAVRNYGAATYLWSSSWRPGTVGVKNGVIHRAFYQSTPKTIRSDVGNFLLSIRCKQD